jgi:hypothetical protein
MAAALVILGAPGIARAQTPAPGPDSGARPPAQSRPNTQRARIFPPGRCDQTRAAIALDRGELGVMTRGTLSALNRDGAYGYVVGEPGCRVRILVVPEREAAGQGRRAPAVPHQEPFRR